MYGNLTVFAGPMFCGKSSALLQQHIYKNKAQPNSCVLLKPAFDRRYSETEVVTHSGLKARSLNVVDIDRTLTSVVGYQNVMIDEVQFFTTPYVNGDIIKCVKYLLSGGTNVYAAGLDMDWMGNAFPITASLLAMADDVHKLKSICSVSGKPATKTYKISQGGGSVELGETDKYEARCNEHWR